ncbi:hypothetical protein GS501_02755 [Saccharibacter sp. 17.LH.SD]|uniref:hypothetical protein n=1 Tax=Saccharibacter sp. 17.LH.SD TaxID=2689393 RepID=UPI00136E57B8|nr:hypothetical protein [Saccharibacter sp. 17.LH.SD]MXV43973.1 hypothetical protein [Saccharibacter sp. 17.LH.SD]
MPFAPPKWVTLCLYIGAASLITFGSHDASARHRRHHHAVPQKKNTSTARPVILTTQPDSALDATARKLNKDTLKDAARYHERPIILVGSAPLSATTKDTNAALFVQIQSARLCGAGGCTTSVYYHDKTGWKLILDAVSGSIAVLSTHHAGMYDLLVDGNDRWVWNGSSYQDTSGTIP